MTRPFRVFVRSNEPRLLYVLANTGGLYSSNRALSSRLAAMVAMECCSQSMGMCASLRVCWRWMRERGAWLCRGASFPEAADASDDASADGHGEGRRGGGGGRFRLGCCGHFGCGFVAGGAGLHGSGVVFQIGE